MIVFTAAGWMLAISLLTLGLSLLVLPWLLTRLPADYFVQPPPQRVTREQNPAVFWLIHIAKNLVGGVLLVSGLVMLFTPGQGLLTLLAGLFLMEFPGKRSLEWRLIRRPRVLALINAMRQKAGQPPLWMPGDSGFHSSTPASLDHDAVGHIQHPQGDRRP